MTRRSHSRWRSLLLALALALAACGGAGGPAANPAPARPLDGLDAYVRQAVADWGIAGLSIAVVRDDSVVFAGGYGVRDVRTGAPVDENTLFAIGSNSKLFTAVAAGMLVDEGRLAWDDPAAAHLSGFQLHDPYVTREITLRDLLSHRSGLGRRGDLLWYGSEFDRAEILRRIRHLEPNAGFRSEFGYQNVMFLAAGEAVGRASGIGWDRFVEERIFTPLGMERSSTTVRALERDANVALPHIPREGRLLTVPYRNLDNIAPAGSINSSAREMALWLRMLLGDGALEARRLIDAEILREITSPQTVRRMAADSLFPSIHFSAYGLGVGMNDYRGVKVLRHTGGIDGMLSLVGLIPEERLGVVVLTNTSGYNDLFTALMYRVFDAYLGAPERDWSARLRARAEEARRRAEEAEREVVAARLPGTRSSREPEAYAGRYVDPLYGDLEVALEGDRLVLRRGSSLVGDLEHWHHDTFRVTWRDPVLDRAFVTFALDRTGAVGEARVEDLAAFARVADPSTRRTH